MKKFAVIMAGGSGTRFWPRSSSRNPKQFLALTSSLSQLQLTWQRLGGVVSPDNRLIVCTEALKAATQHHVRGANILAEPIGRNTMAAVCWSAWSVAKTEPNSVVAILPADAYVQDVNNFKLALKAAYEIAETEKRIVCLGIKPTFPATAYGYIQQGSRLDSKSFEIKKFVEKPSLEKAKTLIASTDYTWNAGIFVFSCEIFKAEVRKHAPEFAQFFDSMISKPKQLKLAYKTLPAVAVDVALMEKTDRGAVIAGTFGWNDLGSWPSLAEVLPANHEAGVIQAPSGCIAIDAKNNIAHVTAPKFLALIGVEDLIVVETENTILVCRKDRAQDIKKLTNLIEKNKKLARKLL